MRSASQIIEALGGTSAVAVALKTSPSTVQSWKEVNFIPEWRQSSLLALALEREIGLATTDFPTSEDRRPRAPLKERAA